MEVHVHNHETFSIPIYDVDSDDSILRRICAHRNTIPQYVFLSEKYLRSQRSVTPVDLIAIFKRDTSTLDLTPVYPEIQPYNFGQDIVLTAWVMTRDIPKELDAYHVSVIMHETIRTIFPQSSREDIENLVSRHTALRDEFLLNVQEIQSENTVFTESCSRFEGVEPYDTTPFFEEHIVYRIFVPNPDRFTLKEIFNRIRVNTRFYYVSFGKIVKLQSSLRVPENREDEEETDGCLWIYETDKEDPISVSAYEKNRLTIRISMKKDDHRYVKDILDFLVVSSVENMERIGVNGVFYIKNCRYNSYVMRDLCMNDPFISSFVRLNENDLSQKSSQNLFLYYFSPRPVPIKQSNDPCEEDVRSSRFGHLTASMSIHQKSSIHEQPKTITNTDPFVRVYIKRTYYTGYVPEFQRYLSRLMRYYDERSSAVREAYKTYSKACVPFLALPFEGERKIEIGTDYVNKYPNLYKIPGTNYKRKDCQKNKQPSIITREELETLGLKPEEYLVYPKEPVDGVCPEIYRCVHPVFRYPGLKTISNNTSTVFRYYPCCYEVPKLESANYKDYYHNVPPPQKPHKETKTAYIVREENKIVHNTNQIAEIPLILKRFFTFMNPAYSYFRIGTPQNINSLLYCVMMADLNRDVNDPKNYKMTVSVDQARKSLADRPENIDLILQENTDRTREEIVNDIVENRTFLDPRRYGVLLEQLYGIRLVVLERTENRIRPISYRTNRNHYSYRRSLPFLFVYMHFGSIDEAKTLSYPHCEPILYKRLELDKIAFHFPYSKDMDHLLSGCVRYFSKNRVVSAIPPFDYKWVVGQTIDAYGKLRILHVEHNKKRASLFLSEPQAPIYKPCVGIKEYKDILVYDEVRSMLGTDDAIVGEYDIGHPSLTLLKIRHAPIDLYAVVHRKQSVSFLKDRLDPSLLTWIRHEMDLHHQERSELHEYRRIRMTSLAIQDIVLYTFSRVEKDIGTFLDEHTVIEPGYVYPIEWDRYDFRFENTEDFMRDGKIILPSLSFQERIRYLLSWKLEYEKDVLDGYKDMRVMPFYLRDIQEYRPMPGQVLVMRDALPQIRENTVWTEYPYETVLKDKTGSFIYARKRDNNDVVSLGVSCESQKEAICVLDTWKTKGYVRKTNDCDAEETKEEIIEENTRYYPILSL
jgi:hypothetical protein